MNITKAIIPVLCCGLGTAIGWWAINASWLLSLISGPLQHLGLAFSRLDNSSEYLDGVSRVGFTDYIFALIQFCLWLIGVSVVFYWFRSESKIVAISLVFGWVVVGVFNAYLFAIRSV